MGKVEAAQECASSPPRPSLQDDETRAPRKPSRGLSGGGLPTAAAVSPGLIIELELLQMIQTSIAEATPEITTQQTGTKARAKATQVKPGFTVPHWYAEASSAHAAAREEVAKKVFDLVVRARLVKRPDERAEGAGGGQPARGTTSKAQFIKAPSSGRERSRSPSGGGSLKHFRCRSVRPPTAAESAVRWENAAAARAKAEGARSLTPAAHAAAFLECSLLRASPSLRAFRDGRTLEARLRHVGFSFISAATSNEDAKGKRGDKPLQKKMGSSARLKASGESRRSAGNGSDGSKFRSSSAGSGSKHGPHCGVPASESVRLAVAALSPLEGREFCEGGEWWVVARVGVDAETRQRVAYYHRRGDLETKHDRCRE